MNLRPYYSTSGAVDRNRTIGIVHLQKPPFQSRVSWLQHAGAECLPASICLGEGSYHCGVVTGAGTRSVEKDP